MSTTPSAATPGLKDGTVHDVVQVGSTVVVGGSFTAVTSNEREPLPADEVAQPWVMAFDATTGALSRSFAPRLDGAVKVVRPGPEDTVYVGGDLKHADGVRVDGLVRLRLSDGQQVPGFAAPLRNGVVNALEVVGSRLFVGGTFTTFLGTRARVGLATLDAGTGALDPYLDSTVAVNHNWTPASDPTWARAQVGVVDLDVSPDGTKLVAIGNFAQVDAVTTGVDQIAMWDLGSSAASLRNWRTTRFADACNAKAYDSWVRDVDFAPDGSYFAVVTVGGYLVTGLCDTATRWNTADTGPAVAPAWVASTGGDSLLSVAVTGAAVYVGGHQRWLNNGQLRDRAGGGAVPRPGLAALDPLTGLPLAWNPGRHPRGAGTAALHATPQGLWTGSDTETIGTGDTRTTRRRLAFFPVTDAAPRDTSVPSLPGGVYLGPPVPAPSTSAVLHRVNAGGPALLATDGGPEWAEDQGVTSTYRPVDSTTSVGPGARFTMPVPRLHASVPAASTPSAVFADHRSDSGRKGDGREMQWRFPVPVGKAVTVRLYFATRSSTFAVAGKRVFDIVVDGRLVADDFDIFRYAGDQTGSMRSFTVTSDGSVDVRLDHEVGSPIIDALEVVAAGSTVAGLPYGELSARTFDGRTPGAAPVPTTSGVDANGVRGAVMIGGRLFYGKNNGRLYRRTLAGGTWSASTRVDPHDDPVWSTVATGSKTSTGADIPYRGTRSTFFDDLTNITSLHYEPRASRLYYTMHKESQMYSRAFSPDSGVVHTDRQVVPGTVVPTDLVGAFVDAGSFYYARSGSNVLHRAAFGWSGPLGTPTTIPAPPGGDWRSRALFLGPPLFENRPPVARVSATCTELRCTADASASSDPDGPVSSYRWTWGDGSTTTTTVPGATHVYASAGSRTATLEVTDPEGLTGSTTFTASPTAPVDDPPVAAFVASCDLEVCTFDGSGSTDEEGQVVGWSWSFGDGRSGTGRTVTHAFPGPGTYTVSMTAQDDAGGRSTTRQDVVVPSRPATAIAFRGASSLLTATATILQVPVPAAAEAGDALLLKVSTSGPRSDPTVPAGWTEVARPLSSAATSVVWQRVATAADAADGVTVPVQLTGPVKAVSHVLVYSGTSTTSPVAAAAASADPSTGTTSHLAPALDVPQGGWLVRLWSDKSSTTTSWTAPTGTRVRAVDYGKGSGFTTSLVADEGAARPAGRAPAQVATTDASSVGTGITLVLAPAG